MRRKTPLMLIELTIMVLVFTLAAAMCLQAFVYSEKQSQALLRQERAVLCAQNAAEVLKHFSGNGELAARQLGGTVDDAGCWQVGYDTDWQQTDREPAFVLRANLVSGGPELLGEAVITVRDQGGNELFSLPVCWQKEVDSGEE